MTTPRSLTTLLVAGALSAGVSVLAGCGTTGTPTGTPTDIAAGATTSPSEPPLSAGEAHESEVPSGWDQTPDGPSPTPDAQLTDAQTTEILRTRASAKATPDSCTPEDVTARFVGFDAAAGSRFSNIEVTNTSSRTCVADGVPGIGVRGTWGNAFTVEVTEGVPTRPVDGAATLAPGERALAEIKWGGSNAGSEEERASLVLVQLAQGQPPLRINAQVEDLPPDYPADMIDIGMFTTVRPTGFVTTP